MFEAVVTLTKGVAGGGGGGDGGGGAGAHPPPPPPQAPRYSPETTPITASPTRIAWPTPQRPSGAHAVLHQVLDTSIEFLRFLDTTCDWRLVQCRIAGSRAPGRRRPGVSSEPVALRTVADAVGGMAALAEKTGLSRETLYPTARYADRYSCCFRTAPIGAAGSTVSPSARTRLSDYAVCRLT